MSGRAGTGSRSQQRGDEPSGQTDGEARNGEASESHATLQVGTVRGVSVSVEAFRRETGSHHDRIPTGRPGEYDMQSLIKHSP